MRSTDASVWFVPANDGEDFSLLIKLPMAQIKAIIRGCSASVVLKVADSALFVGIRVFDIPGHPLITVKIQRQLEEHQALSRFVETGTAPVFLFNELDFSAASSTATMAFSDRERVLSAIENPSEFYIGERMNSHDFVLDQMEQSMSFEAPNEVEFPLAFGKWESLEANFLGVEESHLLRVDSRDEGELLERMVWASLESVFPLNLYKSPQVRIGSKTRELTDVLTSYEYGSFLFEAKALSEYSTSPDRSLERRVSSVQSHIKKALDQLVGAGKALDRGDEVFDSKGNLIQIERKNPPHAIVLVSELIEAGDWSETVEHLMNALSASRMYVHILDLRELLTLLKIGRGQPELLDYNLMERCKKFVKYRNIFLRSKAASNK